MEQKPKFRYIKRTVLYIILAVVCFILKIYALGIFLFVIAIGFGILSYVQKDKMYLSEEEAAAEYVKYKHKQAKKKKKENKKSKDDALNQQLQKIEEEFDFDYGDEAEYDEDEDE